MPAPQRGPAGETIIRSVDRQRWAAAFGASPEQHVLLSQLVGQPVLGEDGTRVGTLHDVVVQLEGGGDPLVRGVLLETTDTNPLAHISDLSRLAPPTLRSGAVLDRFHQERGELLVYRDLLDRWLIDMGGSRVVRASDVDLGVDGGNVHLVAVDVSSDGIARRIGPRWLARLLYGEFVRWRDLEALVSVGPSAGLTGGPGRLADLHPSDLARLAEQLADAEAASLLEALGEPQAAAMLEEIRDDRQAALLRRLPRARAVNLLSRMEPDAAADVLDDFEAPEADAFLSGIDPPQAGLIREVLDYPPDSAGGIMNPEFAMAFAGQTVREVVTSLRHAKTEHRLEDWYVFVVGDTRRPRLVGIVSPLDLLAAEGDEQLAAIMQPAKQFVRPEDSARAAATIMAEYNLLILPVVDRHGELQGVISADDALDVLIK